ncbi:hypothetical protein [Burkholderia sp. Bp8998]|uniref:hypothetical protein n=1 Tax=Burkholderia sp. Bp8998 TaxID=2184557 RepID=UPI0021AB478D|nr:hypothetical protein [Burkholderia sp. Bp8998]
MAVTVDVEGPDDVEVLPDVYVCGPPPLVEGAREVAVAAGTPDAQFASERFTA